MTENLTPKTDSIPAVDRAAPCSACPKGSRSGLSFDQLHALARTDRMEWGMAEPLYYHAPKCGRKCDGTCKVAYMVSPFVPYSGFIKSIGRTAAPDAIDRTSLKGSILASSPVFWLGEREHNIYGLPVYGEQDSVTDEVMSRAFWAWGLPFMVDTQGDSKTADVLAYTVKSGMAPPMKSRGELDKQLKNKDKTHPGVTDQQWSRYNKAAGDARLAGMKAILPRLEKMAPENHQRPIQDIGPRAYDAGLKAMGPP